ncbi:M56 family metallopeptidase [Rhodococcus sp. WAY2]|uniref:M56 family metallopeptidase n=1 Tax=Rhodococcus sp. WAY2 TaxID=2663121 RepID=UPI00131FAA42|nr:M56 family metallopeptidase [Rhodococcus sp. WAY2]QHE74281.1 Peptidase M48, Ste24p precursor [Rhodococcus sp. WAY2]
MIVATLWTLGGLLLAMLSPRILTTMICRFVNPTVILATWAAIVVGTFVNLTVPAVVLLLPNHGGVSAVFHLAQQCWLALHDGASNGVETLVGAVAAIAITALTAGILISWLRMARERRHTHDKHLGIVHILEGTLQVHDHTLWVPLEQPLAYSIAGRPSLIVASTGLRSHLRSESVAAVLAHERAHLRGRHHLFVRLAESVALVLPWLAIMRASPVLVRTLVELAADASAARTHGRSAVHDALRTLRPHAVPSPALAMATDTDCTAVRLHALATDRNYQPGIRRSFAAYVTAMALPVLPGVLFLCVMALTSCLAVA